VSDPIIKILAVRNQLSLSHPNQSNPNLKSLEINKIRQDSNQMGENSLAIFKRKEMNLDNSPKNLLPEP